MTNKPRKNKKSINVIMAPIDDREKYVKSLGNAMLDILEKQLGSELLALSMEELKKQLGK